MSANVLSIKIVYMGCENRIWREVEISDGNTLTELGYLIMASFDTCAYHLFGFDFAEHKYRFPDDDFADGYEDIMSVKLSKLHLNIGDELDFIYDYGCDQIFKLVILTISNMPKGCGRSYPKITNGAGLGIIDDTTADELLEIMKDIDKKGISNYSYSKHQESNPEYVWDYRKYNIKADNSLLKGEIKRIRESFEGYQH